MEISAPTGCYDFKEFCPKKKRANFLVFGLSGTGKSSIINSAYCTGFVISNGRKEHRTPLKKAPVRKLNQIGQCTKEFGRYIFRDNEYKVNFYDTWGWTGKVGTGRGKNQGEYSIQEFELILSGLVRENHNLANKIQSTGSQEDIRIIDAVIFVVECSILSNMQYLVTLRKYCNIAKRKPLPVLFAVSKMDIWASKAFKLNILENSDPAKMVQNVHASNGFQRIQEAIQKKIGDNDCLVVPCVNYNENANAYNPVVDEFVRSFTNQVIEYFENYKPEDHIQPKDGIFFPNPFVEIEKEHKNLGLHPLEELLFQKEPLLTVQMDDRAVGECTVPLIIFRGTDKEEGFLMFETFFRLLLFQKTPWRLIAIDMKSFHDHILVGLYNPALKRRKVVDARNVGGKRDKTRIDYEQGVYFEGLFPKKYISMDTLKRSFDIKRRQNVQTFMFLDAAGIRSTNTFDPRTKFVKISVTSANNAFLLLTLRDWTKYHTFVMNIIQQKKNTQIMEIILKSRYRYIRDKTKEVVSRLKVEVAKLKGKIQEMSDKVENDPSIKVFDSGDDYDESGFGDGNLEEVSAEVLGVTVKPNKSKLLN